MSEEKKEEKKELKAQPQPAPVSQPQPTAAKIASPATGPTVAAPVPGPSPAPQAGPPPPGTIAPKAPAPSIGAVPPPRPVAIPRPIMSPPVAPPKKQGRRGFLAILTVVGVALALVPYLPWGEFLSASIRGSGALVKQKVVIDNNSSYKAAAGKPVNVNDLNTFPPNSHWAITYPSAGDSTLDAQNSDTFAKFELIRLPPELGGNGKDASSFVAFSKVCVHLWCSPNYGGGPAQNPTPAHQKYECPCHGSIYRIPDGQAILGPAAVQPAPANAIPILKLSSDSTGQLFIEPPPSGKFDDVTHNGVLGLGRALFQGGKVNEYKFEDGTSAN